MWNEVDYAKAIVKVLEANYPETLSRAFIFPISGAFRWGWRAAQVLLDEDTKSKLQLCTEKDLGEKLAEHIDPTVLSPAHLADT
jgi:hypothetical protein